VHYVRINKRTIAISTASLVLVGGLSAFAYVSATGTGTGSATTIGASSVQGVELTADVAGSLAPGGTADIVLTGTNPNSYTVSLAPVTVTISALPTGCSEDEFHLTQGSGASITSGDVVTQGTPATIQWGMDAEGAGTSDACLGAALALAVSAGPTATPSVTPAATS
jgi:hypothetical protein